METPALENIEVRSIDRSIGAVSPGILDIFRVVRHRRNFNRIRRERRAKNYAAGINPGPRDTPLSDISFLSFSLSPRPRVCLLRGQTAISQMQMQFGGEFPKSRNRPRLCDLIARPWRRCVRYCDASFVLHPLFDKRVRFAKRRLTLRLLYAIS